MKEKQDILEKEQEVMKQQFSEVLQEMKEIKTQLRTSSSDQFPGLPEQRELVVISKESWGRSYLLREGQ